MNPSLRTEEDVMSCPSSTTRQEKGGKSASGLPFLFSSQTLRGGEAAHPHWGRGAAFLSPLVQMLIFSRTALTDTPRNDA